MKGLWLKIISVVMWAWFLLSSVFLSPILLVLWSLTFWWDRNRRILHQFSCFWGAQYVWMNPLWSLKISGRRKIKPGQKYILVSNHQSLVDIVLVYSLFRHFRWTSKVENFRLPFVGWVLAFNRSIRVYRNDAEGWEKFREQALREMGKGNSIMIFPEGTRSKTGKLGKFREGAFRLAHETGTEIVPMVLEGTSKAIPKSGWSLKGRQKMSLKVLDPIPFSSFSNSDPKETMKRVHQLISVELEKAHKS